MNGRDILIAILVALALATASSSVQAHEDSGTDTLEFLEHVAVEIDATDDASTKVTWDIKVTEGVPVNVFFMPEEGYGDYIDPLKWEFSYYLAHSKNNTESFKKTVVLNEDIIYYLVIENTGYSSMDNSTVEYDVTWDEAGGLFGPWCWVLIIIILIIMGGLGFTIWRRRQGSGSGSEGPMEEPAPGTTTYTAPEEEETWEGAQVYEGPETEYPDPAEGETWGGAQVHESVEPVDTGATELSPQPEPPDHPTLEERGPAEVGDGGGLDQKGKPPQGPKGDEPTG